MQVLPLGSAWAVDCMNTPKSPEMKDCSWIRNQYLVNISLEGSSLQQVNWESMTGLKFQFSEVNMEGAVIKGAKFIDSTFKNSNFTNSIFSAVRFENVDFKNSDFTNARFVRCFFRDVDLKNSNIRPEQLIEPILISSELPDLHHPAKK